MIEEVIGSPRFTSHYRRLFPVTVFTKLRSTTSPPRQTYSNILQPPTGSAHFNPPPTTPPRQSLHLYSSAPPRQPISTPLERPLNSHYQRPQLLFTGVHESPTDLCIVTINHPTRTALFNPLQPPHLVVTSNPTQHPTFTNRCPDCGRYIISNLYDVNMFCLIPMSLIIFNNNNNNNNKS